MGVRRALPWVVGAALVAVPFVYHEPYPLHIMVIVLIWSLMYTSWSVMPSWGSAPVSWHCCGTTCT